MNPHSLRRHALTLLFCGAALLSACEHEPDVPPEMLAAANPAPDFAHAASLGGSEMIVVPNISISIESPLSPGGETTLTLRSAAPPGQPALLLTGRAILPAGAPLARARFSVLGPADRWIGATEGVRSDRWRYQAAEAVIIIDRDDANEMAGRIEGQFFRFHRRRPQSEPPQPESFRGTFSARRTTGP